MAARTYLESAQPMSKRSNPSANLREIMYLKRLLLGLEIMAGLMLVGLGHYYVSSLRDAYPIDGFIYYALALLLFAYVWRTVRKNPGPAWNVVRDNLRVSWGLLREALRLIAAALRALILPMSARMLLLATVSLNLLAAALALLWPSNVGLWAILWLASVVALVIYALPRLALSNLARNEVHSTPEAAVTIEPKEVAGTAPNPIGLVVGLALLGIGQLAVRSTATPDPSSILSGIARSFNESLRINLSGDPATVLGGGLMLIIGTIIFAVVTRHSVLVDRPRFRVEASASSGSRWDNRWLIVAVLGFVIWLSMLNSVAASAKGWGGVLPWLLALILIGACWWKIDRVQGVRHAIALDRREVLALGLAALAILILFTFRLGDLPNSIWGDEGAFFTTATDIAKGQVPPDFFGLGAYSYPLLGSMYQSIWISLFGPTIGAWRLGSIIVTLLAIVPIYFLARATLGRRVAWISLALYVSSPYLLAYARLGYNNSQAILPVAATLALMWLAIRRDSRLFAFVAGCAGGLGFFTYTAAQTGVVLALSWLGWLWITRGLRRWSAVRLMMVYALGVLLVAAPTFAYGLTRFPDLFTYKRTEAFFANVFYGRDFFRDDQLFAMAGPIQVGGQQWFYAPNLYVILLARGLVRTALSFHVPSLITQHFLVGALADPFGLVYLLGLGWCLRRARQPGYIIWPIWLILGVLGLSVIDSYPPRDEHMVPVIPALAVLGALGLVIVIDLLAKLMGLPERVKPIALAASVMVLGFVGLRAYFVEMPQRYPPDIANAMLWQLQQMPRGSDLTLIQPANSPSNFQMWGLRELDRGVNFHLLKLEAVASTDLRELCHGDCRFFFGASDYDRVMPYLTQTFGAQNAQEYPNMLGAVQAYMFAPKQ